MEGSSIFSGWDLGLERLNSLLSSQLASSLGEGSKEPDALMVKVAMLAWVSGS
jgi:hypothetical protein